MNGCTGDRGGQQRRGKLEGILLLGLFTGLSVAPSALWANPTGANVVNGTATMSTSGNTLNVVNSNGAIIDWQDFNIAAGETTNFLQSGSNSAVLNRVVGTNLSAIYGTLSSNGKVFLINPNGVMIGATGIINTAGFIASTLNVSNSDFLANNGGAGAMHFTGTSTASVQNLGVINAVGGDVYLVAQHVVNGGTITASEVNGRGGIVGAYATDELYLTTGTPNGALVRVGSGSASAGTGTGIDNSGVVNAVQADLKATGNLYSLAINNSGVIRATGAVAKNGVVHLVALGGVIQSSGTLAARNADGSGGTIKAQSGSGGTTLVNGVVDASASAGTGGKVELSGDYVALYGTGSVDVSGPSGGGVANIGGSAHGNADPTVYNAISTYIGSDTTINANATENGNGGTVAIWSNAATRYYGTITALGAGTGTGGWVETSGAYLDMQGHVNTGGGQWLLDPDDVYISDTNPDSYTPGNSPYNFSGAGATSYINTTDLFTALSTNNVTVSTDGNITVNGSTDLGIATSHGGPPTQNYTLALTTTGGSVTMQNVDWEGSFNLSVTANKGITLQTVTLAWLGTTSMYAKNTYQFTNGGTAPTGDIGITNVNVALRGLLMGQASYGADSLTFTNNGAGNVVTAGTNVISQATTDAAFNINVGTGSVILGGSLGATQLTTNAALITDNVSDTLAIADDATSGNLVFGGTATNTTLTTTATNFTDNMAGALTVTDTASGSLVLGGTFGSMNMTAAAVQTVSFNNAVGNVTLSVGNSNGVGAVNLNGTLTGNLSASTTSGFDQTSGPLLVSGNVTLDGGAYQSVLFTDPGNIFGGALSVTGTPFSYALPIHIVYKSSASQTTGYAVTNSSMNVTQTPTSGANDITIVSANVDITVSADGTLNTATGTVSSTDILTVGAGLGSSSSSGAPPSIPAGTAGIAVSGSGGLVATSDSGKKTLDDLPKKTDPATVTNSNSASTAGTVPPVKNGDTTPANDVASQSGDTSSGGAKTTADGKTDNGKKSTTLGSATTTTGNTGGGKETVMGPGSSSVIGASGISSLNIPPPPQLNHALSSEIHDQLRAAIFRP